MNQQYFSGGTPLLQGGQGQGQWAAQPQPQVGNGPMGQGNLANSLAGLLGGGGGGPQAGGIMQLFSQIFGGGGGGAGGSGGGAPGGGFSIQSLLGLLQGGGGGGAGGGPQGMSHYQQVFTGGTPLFNPNASPPDFPPADMGDPFGGISPGDVHSSPFGLANVSGFGQNPSFGSPAFGPTQVPTWWTNYPGVGNVPFAVPNTPGGWQPPINEKVSKHTPPVNPF